MTLDRSKPPILEKIDSFITPKIEFAKSEFKNDVLFIENHKFPIIQFGIILEVGSKNDPADKLGITYLTAKLLDKGAGGYSFLELAEKIESLGSYILISPDKDQIAISLISLTENFEETLSYFFMILNNPLFDELEFSREKKRIEHLLVQRLDYPGNIANSVFKKQVFRDYPYYCHPLAGTIDSFASLTLNDVKEYYNSKIKFAEKKAFISGDITKEELLNQLSKYEQFNEVEETELLFTADSSTDEKRIIIINKPDAKQTEIRVGCFAGKKDNEEMFALGLFSLILGGQFNSRLNMNLREKHGFTYSIFSEFDYNLDAGYFVVDTSVDTANTTDTLIEILSEVKTALQGFTEDELAAAKETSILQFPSQFETITSMAVYLADKILGNLPDDYLETFVQKINSVTNESIVTILNNKINLNNTVIVLVGNLHEVLPTLKRLDGFTIYEAEPEGDIIAKLN